MTMIKVKEKLENYINDNCPLASEESKERVRVTFNDLLACFDLSSPLVPILAENYDDAKVAMIESQIENLDYITSLGRVK